MTRVVARLMPLLVPLLGVTAVASPATPASAPREKPLVAEVVSIRMTVKDVDASVAFFRDVLTFEKVSDDEAAGRQYEQLTGVLGVRLRVVRMRLGDEVLELTEFLVPRGRPVPADSRSNDRWFQHVAIVVTDMDEAYRRLRKHKVEHASTGPQTLPEWNKAAAGIKAFYFKDPDGHVLEVIQFPPDKGDTRWRKKTDRLLLGIDHTAIAVKDTEKSLAYYRDRLGLKAVGGSENSGTEQEHLNNVVGARLRTTTLRAAKGPGVELLEYLSPRDGRPMPSDTKPNDPWHWQTRVKVGGCGEARDALKAGRNGLVSPGVLDVPADPFGPGKAFLARDPDGHAVLFTQR
jgi:catechol 2,3-dioxygenase-like lactoylglutathione lyase family enzyme